MRRDLFCGFVEYERERIHKEQTAAIAELENSSCEIHKTNLEKHLAYLSGQLNILNHCEQIISDMLIDDKPKIKLIHNPVTGNYYEIRQRTTEYGRRGVIKGLWGDYKP